MSEADWWVCARCQSLNNLSARKCYSCRTPKPKEVRRSSEVLGYRPVISWDGKVRLEPSLPPTLTQPGQLQGVSRATPLREPPRRSILDVAPRPPHGARISYRPIERRSDAPGSLPAAPGSGFVGVPIVAGQPSPSDRGPSRFVPGRLVYPASGPSLPPPAPPAPVPMQPAEADRSHLPEPGFSMQVGPWPHWQELLSAPTPNVERLRGSLSSPEAAPSYRIGWGRVTSGLWPDTDASRSESAEGRGAAAEWPRADLAVRSSESPES